MKFELWGGREAQICRRFVATDASTNMLPICNISKVINMKTYMMLKADFQNLSKIAIFRKPKDREWMLI